MFPSVVPQKIQIEYNARFFSCLITLHCIWWEIKFYPTIKSIYRGIKSYQNSIINYSYVANCIGLSIENKKAELEIWLNPEQLLKAVVLA